MPNSNRLWTLAGPPKFHAGANMLTGESPVEVLNAHQTSGGVLQMRHAFATEDYSASGLDGALLWCGRHVTNSGGEEAWAASNNSGAAELGRRSGGTWASATFSDTVAVADLPYMHSATQNGKLFLAYNSDVNRLHVWDGTSLRRVGLAQPAAPTLSTLGGAGITDTHYYRVRWVVQVSSVVVRRSEAGASANLALVDDSGWQVTRPTAANEGETHWEVEASEASTGPWYRIATVAIATTTYDHTSDSIDTTNLTDIDGLYYTPPSCKFIISDGGVLIMAGAWESSSSGTQTAPFQNRVWFTRPLGATDVSDDESITQTTDINNWIDIGDAGPITGLAGPLNGEIFVFKLTTTWKLVPTGNLDAPYQRVLVRPDTGAVDQRLIATGDVAGVATVFFASQTEVHAVASAGFARISDPITRDLKLAPLSPSNGLLRFEPSRRILLLLNQDLSSAGTATQLGSYLGYQMDCVNQQWSCYRNGLSDESNARIWNGATIQDTTGQDLLYLCGEAPASTGTLVKWTTRCGLDGARAFSTTLRVRKMLVGESGEKATVFAPTVWYRAPQGSATSVIRLTATYYVDGVAGLSQFTTLNSTDFGVTGDVSKFDKFTFEDMRAADVSVLDLKLTMTVTSGGAYTSIEPACINLVQIPYTGEEPFVK